jgi:hypothetical protein
LNAGVGDDRACDGGGGGCLKGVLAGPARFRRDFGTGIAAGANGLWIPFGEALAPPAEGGVLPGDAVLHANGAVGGELRALFEESGGGLSEETMGLVIPLSIADTMGGGVSTLTFPTPGEGVRDSVVVLEATVNGESRSFFPVATKPVRSSGFAALARTSPPPRSSAC